MKYLSNIIIIAGWLISSLFPQRQAASGGQETTPGNFTNSNQFSTFKVQQGDSSNLKIELSHGGIIRGSRDEKKIYLVFTGHEFADGYEKIKSALKKHQIKASFFFTGDFYRNENYHQIIYQLKNDGHYLGAHSDKHLLYASWENRDSTLLPKEKLLKDIDDNYKELKRFGIEKEGAIYFMPPYEWYNNEISEWINEMGLKVINFTPGTYSNADWTIPELNEKYYSSEKIYNKILSFEENNVDGLNGFILLTHIGADPRRTDKFYFRLDDLLVELEKRGYSFESLHEF